MTTFVLVPGPGGRPGTGTASCPGCASAGTTPSPSTCRPATRTRGSRTTCAPSCSAVPPGSARDAGGPGLAVVGQSLGGLVAPIVAERCAADLLVLVGADGAATRETGGEWWQATGQGEAMQRFAVEQGRDPDDCDDETLYFHDVPDERARRGDAADRSSRPTGRSCDPWPLDHWPDVPTRVVAGREDRLFPLDFTTALARERVGVEPDVVDTGHLAALADPDALVDLLDRYAREVIGA